jgi:malate dehydrogenase (oxaloacetate-decarboxylating)
MFIKIGKIRIVLKFDNIKEISKIFTEKNLREYIKTENVISKTSKLSVIVTDGTAILGFGNIGPTAGLPVMEGKSMLFGLLGDVEVVPFCMLPRKTPAEEI